MVRQLRLPCRVQKVTNSNVCCVLLLQAANQALHTDLEQRLSEADASSNQYLLSSLHLHSHIPGNFLQAENDALHAELQAARRRLSEAEAAAADDKATAAASTTHAADARTHKDDRAAALEAELQRARSVASA